VKLNIDRFAYALDYATRAHEEQMRKGSEIPYVSHLLAVAALVLEDGGDEDEAIAALLHDVVEDQGGAERLAEVEREFVLRVAAIVESCSDTLVTPKPPWRERKAAYVAHLEGADPSAVRVSLADKVHNVRTIVLDYRRLANRCGSASTRAQIRSGTTGHSRTSSCAAARVHWCRNSNGRFPNSRL
jgi:(p)ppGpp synthase/HD superfamily hydrolase